MTVNNNQQDNNSNITTNPDQQNNSQLVMMRGILELANNFASLSVSIEKLKNKDNENYHQILTEITTIKTSVDKLIDKMVIEDKIDVEQKNKNNTLYIDINTKLKELSDKYDKMAYTLKVILAIASFVGLVIKIYEWIPKG